MLRDFCSSFYKVVRNIYIIFRGLKLGANIYMIVYMVF